MDVSQPPILWRHSSEKCFRWFLEGPQQAGAPDAHSHPQHCPLSWPFLLPHLTLFSLVTFLGLPSPKLPALKSVPQVLLLGLSLCWAR